MGGDAARRAATARLRGVVSDADAADSCPRAASGVHRVRARHQTRKRGHRAPARGGDPVRLGRDARPARALGVRTQDRVCPGRVARALGCLAGRDLPVDGHPAPARRDDDPARPAGRAHEDLAVRPDADGPGPPHRRPGPAVRRVREAPRRHRGGLPAEVGEQEGRGREEQSHRRATLVADLARRPHPRASAGQPEHVRRRAGRPAA